MRVCRCPESDRMPDCQLQMNRLVCMLSPPTNRPNCNPPPRPRPRKAPPTLLVTFSYSSEAVHLLWLGQGLQALAFSSQASKQRYSHTSAFSAIEASNVISHPRSQSASISSTHAVRNNRTHVAVANAVVVKQLQLQHRILIHTGTINIR